MTSQPTTTLRSRYVEQAASDLEQNRRQQHELAERLAVLRQEEALLLDILALAERHSSGEAPPLPEQARDEPLPSPAGSPGAAAGASRDKPAQPLLRDLLLRLLGAHREPRLAKELRDELTRKYPDRTPTPQVVRNTLESLVAKGSVRRHRQQRSVMYSLVHSAQTAPPKG